MGEERGGRCIREVEKEFGVSAATLSRVERGNLPDLGTFAKICKWMKVDPAQVLGVDIERNAPEDEAPVTVATAHFRANQTLSPGLAKALANMIMAGHRMLSKEPSPGED